jgi:hypothetical protein
VVEVSTVARANVCVLLRKEHANEAVEDFSVIQVFHRVSFLSFPRDSGNWWFVTKLPQSGEEQFSYISNKLPTAISCVLAKEKKTEMKYTVAFKARRTVWKP